MDNSKIEELQNVILHGTIIMSLVELKSNPNHIAALAKDAVYLINGLTGDIINKIPNLKNDFIVL